MARFTIITAGQMRAARGLLGWSQGDLARAANVGRQTVARFELGEQTPLVTTLVDMIQAFEKVGIEFLGATSDHGNGVRWDDPSDEIDRDRKLKAARTVRTARKLRSPD